MIFRLRDAPEWFVDRIFNQYANELHEITKATKTSPESDELGFKRMALDYFISKGFDVWLDQDNHLWFDIEQDSPKWTFEILRG